MSRCINNIYCSCGGCYEDVDVTKEEVKIYGCFRDESDIPEHRGGCCITAKKCSTCNVRLAIQWEAPEY